MIELDDTFWANLQAVFDEEAKQLDEIALHPSSDAAAVTLIDPEPLRCGLCDNPILTGDVYWVAIDNCTSTAPDNVAHPICWATELADGADPYRFHGVRRGDF